MAALCNRGAIIFLPCSFFLSSIYLSFFSSPNLSGHRLDVYHTSTHGVTQKSRQKSPSWHHPTTLSGYIFATKACINKRKKNLLSSNISSTCPHNMVNFGPLGAEIVSLVWGTPGNFNGFRILAALLHGSLVVGVSQTAALNRGRHLYSAGRPSRWAFAHISSY